MIAIEGGSPVRDSMLLYGSQEIDQSDIDAVVETLKSEWITTGPKVKEFEDDPVWHARKIQGKDIEIGKNKLGIK